MISAKKTIILSFFCVLFFNFNTTFTISKETGGMLAGHAFAAIGAKLLWDNYMERVKFDENKLQRILKQNPDFTGSTTKKIVDTPEEANNRRWLIHKKKLIKFGMISYIIIAYAFSLFHSDRKKETGGIIASNIFAAIGMKLLWDNNMDAVKFDENKLQRILRENPYFTESIAKIADTPKEAKLRRWLIRKRKLIINGMGISIISASAFSLYHGYKYSKRKN